MTTNRDLDELIADTEHAVGEAIQYFQGPGAASGVLIGDWGTREVLCHFLFWHEATVGGMESVAGGGEPFHVEGSVDEMNARAVARHAGQGLPDLLQEAQAFQERLASGARALGNLEATVMVRSDGNLSGRQRLQTIADHWREHIRALESAPSP